MVNGGGPFLGEMEQQAEAEKMTNDSTVSPTSVAVYSDNAMAQNFIMIWIA